jgi:hypothetical protein
MSRIGTCNEPFLRANVSRSLAARDAGSGLLPRSKTTQHSVALNYFAYNFINIHRTLHISPAMAAGVTDHLGDAGELVSLLEPEELAKRAA